MRDVLTNPKEGDVWKVRNSIIMIDFVDDTDNAIGYVVSDNTISDWYSLKDFASSMVASNGKLIMYAEDNQLVRSLNESGAATFLQGLCVGLKRVG